MGLVFTDPPLTSDLSQAAYMFVCFQRSHFPTGHPSWGLAATEVNPTEALNPGGRSAQHPLNLFTLRATCWSEEDVHASFESY